MKETKRNANTNVQQIQNDDLDIGSSTGESFHWELHYIIMKNNLKNIYVI